MQKCHENSALSSLPSLRFVADAEGRLTFDLHGKLPGKGWDVRVSKSELPQALENISGLEVPEKLAEEVVVRLKSDCLQLLSMAKKTGGVIHGFTAIDRAIEKGQVSLLLLGPDEKPRKDDLRTRLNSGQISTCFTSSELQSALSSDNAVHALLNDCPLNTRIKEGIERLSGYIHHE